MILHTLQIINMLNTVLITFPLASKQSLNMLRFCHAQTFSLVSTEKRTGDNMPIVEISGPALPQDAKDRIAKKVTEIIAEEEKKAFKIDTTSITVVGFRDIPIPNIYLGTKPLAKVLETLPKP